LSKIGLNYVKDNDELNLIQQESTWINKKILKDESYELQAYKIDNVTGKVIAWHYNINLN